MNTPSTKNSRLKKWGKGLLWFLLGILLLLLFLRISLTMGFVHNWVKDTAVSTANNQLNGQLEIEKLSGDLWHEINLSGIRLTRQDDTLASVDSVYAAYNIWALIGGRGEISDLDIHRPQAHLRQEGDRWNVQNLMPESEASEDTTSSTFPFHISDFNLQDGIITVHSDSLPIGPNIRFADLSISSSLGYLDEDYHLNLRDLSFVMHQSELEKPLRVETAATAQDDQLTLEKLVLATGSSMIRSSAFVNPQDSTVRMDMSASPLSWQDVMDYAEEMPLRQDLQLDIGLEGNPENFGLSLSAQGTGLDSLQLTSRFEWKEDLVLQQITADIENFNGPLLLADTSMPTLQNLNAEFNGQLAASNYQQGQGTLDFSAQNIRSSPYEIDQIFGSGELDGSAANLNIEIQRQAQNLAVNVDVQQLWADLPSVAADIRGQNINPGYWAQDTSMAASLSFHSTITGQGWYPDKNPWSYSFQMSNNQFMGQPINDLSLNGNVSSDAASVDGELAMRDGVLQFGADVKNMMQTPFYNYRLQSRGFDIAAVMDIPDFETALNAQVTGTGRGTTIADMKLNSKVSVDSSLVNGELIRELSAHISLSDSVATIDSTRLQSTIAEGSFSGRMNILHRYNPNNELSLALLFKDIEALAPLMGVEEAVAEGELTGKLTPAENGGLQFSGSFDFADISYGEIFSAEKAQGSVNSRIHEDLEYMADLNLTAPVFSGMLFQDLNLKSQGVYADPNIEGTYELEFTSPNEGRIEHGARYAISEDSIEVRTSQLNIISDYRTLSLENPFDLRMQGDTLQMDTMRVSSGDGAFLAMAIPMLSSQEQQLYIYGEALNTAVIQSSLFGETYLEGMLSGRMEVSRQDTSLKADGQLLLSDVQYEETSFDTLIVESRIAEERLKGTLSVRHEGQELVEGETDLPFRLGDPEKLPPEFFEEPVKGSMQLHNISIERFNSIFAEAGITNTTGILGFRGNLEGEAGNPRFTADAKLSDATLSGVPVDSVTAGLFYNHDNAELELDASVNSLKQNMAEITAEVPFYINMKTFALDIPQEEDSVSVDVTTNNFNLAALNDFLDPQTTREVKGRMNGAVEVSGPLGDLQPEGQLQLNKGSFRLVPAGIQVDNIQSTLQFEPDIIRLSKFSGASGNGQMNISGTVGLDEMAPGQMDIRVKARNFRIANTSEYNAIINTDSRAQGSLIKPKITGDLSFISGFLQLDNFGEESVEQVELDIEEQETPNVSMYDSLALDMDISFNRRFFIRNERYLEMEVELDGQLDLVKSRNEDLELFGTMNAPDGYALPLGKRFELQEGTLTLSGAPANPELMIRTQYEPPEAQEDIIIWYVIEGTVEDPKFRYESQPPMELENIVSYTLFGQPFYALDSWKQVVAGSGGGSSVGSVALDVLLDRVEALATQRLGIDVVKIDNTQTGGETGTSVTTGWYLNPKVFFAIQNVITGSTPDTSFLLEYLLRENLKLMIRQGNGIRQGVDIKWNYDY